MRKKEVGVWLYRKHELRRIKYGRYTDWYIYHDDKEVRKTFTTGGFSTRQAAAKAVDHLIDDAYWSPILNSVIYETGCRIQGDETKGAL